MVSSWFNLSWKMNKQSVFFLKRKGNKVPIKAGVCFFPGPPFTRPWLLGTTIKIARSDMPQTRNSIISLLGYPYTDGEQKQNRLASFFQSCTHGIYPTAPALPRMQIKGERSNILWNFKSSFCVKSLYLYKVNCMSLYFFQMLNAVEHIYQVCRQP